MITHLTIRIEQNTEISLNIKGKISEEDLSNVRNSIRSFCEENMWDYDERNILSHAKKKLKELGYEIIPTQYKSINYAYI